MRGLLEDQTAMEIVTTVPHVISQRSAGFGCVGGIAFFKSGRREIWIETSRQPWLLNGDLFYEKIFRNRARLRLGRIGSRSL
jgi:hypothetical protein